MDRLAGKVVLISGATKGQGAAEAMICASEGARVIATGREMEILNETVRSINEKYPDSTISVHLDVSQGDQWDAAVAAGVETFGRIDCLINNAGVGTKGVWWEGTDYELFKKIIDINLWGQFRGIQAVVPEMRKVGGGSIVCVSSMASLIGCGFNAYAPSKGGVNSLARTASVTLGAENIRVNTIIPGTIVTPMTEAMMSMPDVVQHCKDQTSLGFLGEPEDIAWGCVYLLSDEARFVTGAELVIDGGQRYKA